MVLLLGVVSYEVLEIDPGWYSYYRGLLLLVFGNLAGWYSYLLGTIIKHTRVDLPIAYISASFEINFKIRIII